MLINEGFASKIGASIGVIGLIAFIIFIPEAQLLESANLTGTGSGESVRIEGIISSISISNGNAFIDLENKGKASVFYYKPSQGQLAILRKNVRVEITGTITKYRGKKEIMAQKVREIGN